jgi:acetylornithine deacetylase
MSDQINKLFEEAVSLLKELIATPSFSKEEDETAAILCRFIGGKEIHHSRVGNNVYALNKHYDVNKPSIELVLPYLGKLDYGIVGEPTQLEMAVAERGLMVIDCTAEGRSGHAARNEGENALYKAVDDINWLRNYKFEKISPLLGETRLTATVISTENVQHNVVPSQCKFVVDVRVNELYTFDEILDLLKNNMKSKFKPRTTRMKSTSIPLDHILVKAGMNLGRGYYGSPTTSDKALMPFATLKMGPGDSARSHTADEYIYLDEIKEGINTYIQLVNQIV